MKLTSLLMSFFLLCSASASTIGERNLSQAVKELNYALTVEWDQKDPEFYNQQIALFQNEIADLAKGGMSYSEQMKAILTEVNDVQLKKDIQGALNIIEVNKLSESEAEKLIRQIAENSSSKGASWNGGIHYYLGISILVALVVVLAFELSVSSASNNTEGGTYIPGQPVYRCQYMNTCFGPYGPWTDDYGRSTGSGTCGFEFVCGWFK